MATLNIGNYQVLVDEEVAQDIDPKLWECRTTRGRPYFRSVLRVGTWPKSQRFTVWLHRVIALCPKGMQVDHINNDPLDCRRANLRVCTQGDNQRNRGKRRHNKSGVKGVYWSKVHLKWHAQIYAEGKKRHLGVFDSLNQAAEAYDSAAIKWHGEFANINARKGLPSP